MYKSTKYQMKYDKMGFTVERNEKKKYKSFMVSVCSNEKWRVICEEENDSNIEKFVIGKWRIHMVLLKDGHFLK